MEIPMGKFGKFTSQRSFANGDGQTRQFKRCAI
jgi:hypothetical protein